MQDFMRIVRKPAKSVYSNLKLNVMWSVYCWASYFVVIACIHWAAAEWHIDEKDIYVIWQPIGRGAHSVQVQNDFNLK